MGRKIFDGIPSSTFRRERAGERMRSNVIGRAARERETSIRGTGIRPSINVRPAARETRPGARRSIPLARTSAMSHAWRSAEPRFTLREVERPKRLLVFPSRPRSRVLNREDRTWNRGPARSRSRGKPTFGDSSDLPASLRESTSKFCDVRLADPFRPEARSNTRMPRGRDPRVMIRAPHPVTAVPMHARRPSRSRTSPSRGFQLERMTRTGSARIGSIDVFAPSA